MKEFAKVEINEESLAKFVRRTVKRFKEEYPGKKIRIEKSECHVKTCKKKPTMVANFLVSRQDLGLRDDSDGCSLVICWVFTCDEHSFKNNKKLVHKHMEKLRKDQLRLIKMETKEKEAKKP